MKGYTAIHGYVPVAAGAFGPGQPPQALDTYQAYADWFKAYMRQPTDTTVQWVKPQLVASIDTVAGGVFHFRPAGGDEAEACAAYEYRTQPDGGAMSDWQPCPSYRILLGNYNYPVGAVEVRHAATQGRTASEALASLAPFGLHVYPLEVLGWSFQGSFLHTTLRVGMPGYIAIITNTFNHGYHGAPEGGPYQLGTIDFVFDLTGFEGQHQVVAFNLLGAIDYTTPQYQTVVPFT
jgi:hypothetical protein